VNQPSSSIILQHAPALPIWTYCLREMVDMSSSTGSRTAAWRGGGIAGILQTLSKLRRKYSSFLVPRYNTNPEAMIIWKLNVLEATNLAVEAWDEIPAI